MNKSSNLNKDLGDGRIRQKSNDASERWTMITLAMTICDVTDTTTPVKKSLNLIRQDEEHLIFKWSTSNQQVAKGTLNLDDWDEFLEQVREREPHRWASGEDLTGPMGDGDMPQIMRHVITTPAYQLFLAAVDIAVVTELNQQGNAESLGFIPYLVTRNFEEMTGFLPTGVTGGQLFVLPEHLCEGHGANLEELITNSKLGKVTLHGEDAIDQYKYYIPYSTPIGFTTRVSRNARSLWDAARGAYYSVRG